MRTIEEIRQRWSERSRAGALHPQMEITGEGLVLGAGTILAKMGGDSKGAPALSLDDGERIMAVLATAYGRPFQVYVLAKMRRAAELWNEGDKALAHIHLASAALPSCEDMDLALRLFVADELIEAGVAPATLMKAQGFDPAPLDLLKFNPAQPRWPAGNGRDSGRWSGGDGNVTPVAFRGGKERRRHGGGGRFNPFRAIGEFIDEFRKPKESEPAPETKPAQTEVPAEVSKPIDTPESEQPPNADTNKLHHIFDKPGRGLDNLEAAYGSQEGAFRAIESATREAIKEQQISGEFKIRVEVGGYELTVRGNVMSDGTVKVGTAYPWKK